MLDLMCPHGLGGWHLAMDIITGIFAGVGTIIGAFWIWIKSKAGG